MLTVSLTSFSYKQGLPVGDKFHGGGFIFDCRCLENPGRQQVFKDLTGLDQEVEKFLSARAEVQVFLRDSQSLVLSAIESYLARGFSSLEVAYGCTGGQHRSVFCVQELASLLQKDKRIRVKLLHRELVKMGRWVPQEGENLLISKAMVFAAGLGSRLGELTKTLPKPLMEAGEKTLIEHVLERLKSAGAEEVMVNLHYKGEQIEEYLRSLPRTSPTLYFSKEEKLLGTGGGLKRVEEFFRKEPYFVVHNADVYSDLPLQELIAAHVRQQNLVTLATIARPTTRPLLFDEEGLLCGWENVKTGESEVFGKSAEHQSLGFSGIQVISPKLFEYMQDEEGAFDTIRIFLKAARLGEKIRSFRMDHHYWIDIGTPEKLQELRQLLGGSKKLN